MKKVLFAVVLLMIVLPLVSSLSLDIKKTSSDEIMIADLNKSAQFNLEITNLGASDYIEFYNLLGFQMFPVGTTYIGSHETKDITLKISPIGDLKTRGYYTFDYYIRGGDGSQIKENLTMDIIDLKDAFEVGSGDIQTDTRTLQIYIQNRHNFDFGDMKAKFSSAFFNFDKEFSLGSYEKKSFDVQLNYDDFKSLMAGYYTLNVDVNVDGKTADVEGVMKYSEKDMVTTSNVNSGFIINTDVIKKSNEGNVVADTQTVIKKNIISRLFTTITPEPDSVDRQGFTVYYEWDRQVKPGETLEITARTNWLFPVLVALLIVAIVLLVKQYSKTHLVLKKRVNFVRTKGGEFALKVSVFVSAKKYVERVNVIDRLPPLVTLYDKYGGEKPARVDEKSRRLEWNFEKLEAGETRALSYIIFSKVGVLGKFALPTATAIYERDGEISEAESNRAYFMAEQRVKDPDEK
jgi:hypothetical protein